MSLKYGAIVAAKWVDPTTPPATESLRKLKSDI